MIAQVQDVGWFISPYVNFFVEQSSFSRFKHPHLQLVSLHLKNPLIKTCKRYSWCEFHITLPLLFMTVAQCHYRKVCQACVCPKPLIIFYFVAKKSRDAEKVDQHQRNFFTKMKNKKYFLLLWCLVYFFSIAQLGHTKLGKKHSNDKIVTYGKFPK